MVDRVQSGSLNVGDIKSAVWEAELKGGLSRSEIRTVTDALRRCRSGEWHNHPATRSAISFGFEIAGGDWLWVRFERMEDSAGEYYSVRSYSPDNKGPNRFRSFELSGESASEFTEFIFRSGIRFGPVR